MRPPWESGVRRCRIRFMAARLGSYRAVVSSTSRPHDRLRAGRITKRHVCALIVSLEDFDDIGRCWKYNSRCCGQYTIGEEDTSRATARALELTGHNLRCVDNTPLQRFKCLLTITMQVSLSPSSSDGCHIYTFARPFDHHRLDRFSNNFRWDFAAPVPPAPPVVHHCHD